MNGTPKLKVYAASILAFQFRADLRPDGRVLEGSLTMQKPALIPADSIEDAAKRAKEFAFREWPRNAGWYGHQAAIMPVTKEFIELAVHVTKLDQIDDHDEEPGQCFNFE